MRGVDGDFTAQSDEPLFLTSSVSKKLTFIDLFAGCGGLSMGLEKAGFTPILVNELNKDAMQSYLLNRKEFPWLNDFKYNDVKDLVADSMKPEKGKSKLVKKLEKKFKLNFAKGDLDLLVGGPPCQGFSGIGHRRSYGVDRKFIPANKLYEDMAQLIINFRPKIFLFENVKGLTWAKWDKKGKKGEIWEDVQKTMAGQKKRFSELKEYVTQPHVAHAKDYGVPQNRPRAFIVGIRKDVYEKIDGQMPSQTADGFFPDPISERPPNLHEILGDLVDENYVPGSGETTTVYPSKATNKWQREMRTKRDGKIAKKGDLLEQQVHTRNSEKVWRRWEYLLEVGGVVPEGDNDPRMYTTKKFAQRLMTPKWGKDGPNITVCGQPEDYIHFSQPRSITVREWARLQGFPDWYEFGGSRTTGGLRRAGNPRVGNFDRELPRYTQIGNAVPVWLAEHVGLHFRQLLRV